MRSSSWIIVRRSTGEAVFETFSKSIAEAINTATYEALPAYDYLVGLNKKIATMKERS